MRASIVLFTAVSSVSSISMWLLLDTCQVPHRHAQKEIELVSLNLGGSITGKKSPELTLVLVAVK